MSSTLKKLNADQQDLLLNWIAQGETTGFILHMLDEEGISFTKESVSYYRRKYRDAIAERRIKIMQKVPITDRAYRQMIRQMLIENILQQGRLWRYEESKSGKAMLKGNHAIINQILDSAAKDSDDHVNTFDSTVVQFKAMLQLTGEDALNYLKTGKLPDFRQINMSQAAQDRRSKNEEG